MTKKASRPTIGNKYPYARTPGFSARIDWDGPGTYILSGGHDYDQDRYVWTKTDNLLDVEASLREGEPVIAPESIKELDWRIYPPDFVTEDENIGKLVNKLDGDLDELATMCSLEALIYGYRSDPYMENVDDLISMAEEGIRAEFLGEQIKTKVDEANSKLADFARTADALDLKKIRVLLGIAGSILDNWLETTGKLHGATPDSDFRLTTRAFVAVKTIAEIEEMRHAVDQILELIEAPKQEESNE